MAQKNPLYWFSLTPPSELVAAQADFRRALQHAVALVNEPTTDCLHCYLESGKERRATKYTQERKMKTMFLDQTAENVDALSSQKGNCTKERAVASSKSNPKNFQKSRLS